MKILQHGIGFSLYTAWVVNPIITTAPAATSVRKTLWPEWLFTSLVVFLSLVAISLAFVFRQYAEQRRDVSEGLEALETLAIDQSRVMWQALAEIDPGGGFSRLRGEGQRGREAIYEHLGTLYELEAQGKRLDTWLQPSEVTPVSDLELYTSDFLANVQGVFGQMAINSPARLRERFRFGDPRFEGLQGLIAQMSGEAAASARRANRLSAMSSVAAVLATLAALLWGSARLGRLRTQRDLELLEARTETLSASEARFRALVQNGSDFIAVLDGNLVRYASPSSELLFGLKDEALVGKAFWPLFGLSQAPEGNELHFGEADAGGRRDFEMRLNDLSDHPDVQGAVVNLRDVSERKRLEARLRWQALHDPLTELPNRRYINDELGRMNQREQEAAVLFVDLDGFKLVNDSFGHGAGDQLLKEVAARLQSCLRAEDVLARQGGDEFIVLLGLSGDPGIIGEGAETEALAVAERILKVLEPPFTVQTSELFVTASVGVVVAAGAADELIQKADIAMYHAKKAGKAQASLFSETMATSAPERLHLQSDFKRGLERGEFSVYYQPKVSLKSGRTESLEALVRWRHPDKGLISPALFIPFAEETGLIEPLGKIILETACFDAANWQERGVVIAVNLSPLQFRNPNLVAEVEAALQTSGLDPQLLELEITESAVLGDITQTVEVLKQLKALGVRLAIDDFGTGYSNLSHLKHFDVDVLKIDQSFIRGGNPSSETLSDGAIVEAVIAMAKAFGLHVVAEGVETPVHAEQLRDLGCDLGQGYYFSKPVDRNAIAKRLEAEKGS